MNKGIVMELTDSYIVVMSPEGRFDKLPRQTRNCEVGEEILYTAPVKARFRKPQLAITSGLVAAVVLCFVLITALTGGPASGQVVAYVSIDINPSVELGIDNQEIVQDLQGLNSDGSELIQAVDYKGRSVQEVTAAILDKAEQGPLAKGEGDIIISSTLVASRSSVDDEALAAKLKEQVAKHIEEAHPAEASHYEVTAFAAPQEVRQEAQASGVSAGKYAIYLSAVNSGVDVSIDDIKSVSVHELAKENGGIGSLIKPDQPISKKSLKQLLDDEKSGKLTEKLQQAQKNGGTGKSDAKDNNGKGGKPTKGPNPSPQTGKADGHNGQSGPDDKNAREDRNDRAGVGGIGGIGDRNNSNNGNNGKSDNGRNNPKGPGSSNDHSDKNNGKGPNGKSDNNNADNNKGRDDNKDNGSGKNSGSGESNGKNGKPASPSPKTTPTPKPGKPGTATLKPTPSPKAGADGKGGAKDNGKPDRNNGGSGKNGNNGSDDQGGKKDDPANSTNKNGRSGDSGDDRGGAAGRSSNGPAAGGTRAFGWPAGWLDGIAGQTRS
ncbi:hypothetical protein B5M42_011135 [Paenibacillus athensensis]|uniref:RsgI N-terminal anti-sigma domain-containing protein n=1 Tax=Paenibacillus athensensis TaxID=1967502 RepID=A0A4Y8PVU8_9BACL|nr:anti-sigma factor domain-containing protein [Paenibacillus athensensis]MCD1259387.1 hypothetical protein [Paenibacillus athensensis]